MWKICNVFKTVRSPNSFCTWPKAKAACGSDKSQQDDEEKKLPVGVSSRNMHILESLENYSKLCPPINRDVKFKTIAGFSSLPSIAFTNDLVQKVQAPSICSQEGPFKSSLTQKLQKKVKFQLDVTASVNNNGTKQEISTQTETFNPTTASEAGQIDSEFPKPEDLENVSQAAQNLIGSFKNMIGLDLAQRQLYAEAYEQFKHAARVNEHPQAMYNLGMCYYKGYGVQMDLNKAMEMWKKAANLGHDLAKYQVAVGHLRGIGQFQRSEELAMEYLGSMGENCAQPEACTLYGSLLFKTGDYKKAGFYLKKVDENSSPLVSTLLLKISEILSNDTSHTTKL